VSVGGWVALAAFAILALAVDLRLFAPRRAATLKEGVAWSIGWIGVALLAALVVWWLESGQDAVTYLTVYAIERSLSLDNLFVFLLLFGYFGVSPERRGRLLFWGIIAALVLRGGAIVGGVALLDRFHWIVYVLGATLLLLAARVARGVEETVDPERSLAVRATRRIVPGVTPWALCLVAVVAADLAFAVDSIPAAFAITTDALAIWTANAFALMGLRALFSLVEELIRRFRYLDETIAVVLGLVGVKLLIEDLYKVGPIASLAVVLAAFVVGIVASIVSDRRDPAGAAERRAVPS
jgi:tellurite resistance protein TerC